MRQVIFNESINEIEVHPPNIYQEFREASSESAQLLDKKQFLVLDFCPACHSPEIHLTFVIHEFEYFECAHCHSLFMKSRPTEEQVNWYIHESPAAKLRTSHEYQETLKDRYGKLAFYRSTWVNSLLIRIHPLTKPSLIYDIEPLGSAMIDILSHKDEIHSTMVSPRFIPQSNQNVLPNYKEIADNSAQIISCFDILEHQANPGNFLKAMSQKLQQGGYLIATTRAGSGFDIQILRENTPTLVPMEHINLLSVEGISNLFTEAGFNIEEISTPGQLDVQVVESYMRNHDNHPVPPVIEYFLLKRDIYAKENLQNFLQTNLLSSHLRIIGRKN